MSEIEQIPLGHVLDNDDVPDYPFRIRHGRQPFDWELVLPFACADDDGIQRPHEYVVDAGPLDGVRESLSMLIASLQAAETVLEAQR